MADPFEDEDYFNRLFRHHPPSMDQVARYITIRQRARDLADVLRLQCPSSPERTLAIRHVLSAVMHANQSIAIHGPEIPDDHPLAERAAAAGDVSRETSPAPESTP